MSEESAADPGAYFDERSRAGQDPWNDPDSWYEARKRSVLLAVLPDRRYDVAWEPACGGGRLSLELAGRVGRLHASDPSSVAVGLARAATSGVAGVQVTQAAATEDPQLPPGCVDLVVLSEFLYYLRPADRRRVLDLTATVCGPTADVVVASWRHASHDTFGTGQAATDEAAEVLKSHGFRRVASYTEDAFVVVGLTRAAGRP